MLYPDLKELTALKTKAHSLTIRSQRKVVSALSGDYTSPFRGQGMEFEEVRQYVAGDDVRNIDWRVTARTGAPHMKIFTEERERTVMICVDNNETMRFGTRGTFKSVQAARAAALLGWCANGNNDRVGTCVFGHAENNMQFFPPKRSRESLWKMLTLLSDKTPPAHKPIGLEEVLLHLNRAAPTGALVFIISDFGNVTEKLEKQLGNLRKRCDVVLIVVNDPADTHMAAIGNVMFSNGNTDSISINTDSKTGRASYTEEAMKNNDRLINMAIKFRIAIIHIATNRDVYGDLYKELKFIGRKRK